MLDLSYHSPQFRDKGKETQKAWTLMPGPHEQKMGSIFHDLWSPHDIVLSLIPRTQNH